MYIIQSAYISKTEFTLLIGTYISQKHQIDIGHPVEYSEMHYYFSRRVIITDTNSPFSPFGKAMKLMCI